MSLSNLLLIPRLSVWLSSLNGWKRVWLVFCVCVFVYFLIVWPFSSTLNLRDNYSVQQSNVMRDVNSGKCAAYISQPFSTLTEPSYPASVDEVGERILGPLPCYHVYNYRKYNTDGKSLSVAEVNLYYSAQQSKAYWQAFGVGAALAVAICLLLYALGATIAWVLRGFRKPLQ